MTQELDSVSVTYYMAEIAARIERERCIWIVNQARFGKIDSDFRSIISWIECGDSIEKMKSDLLRDKK